MDKIKILLSFLVLLSLFYFACGRVVEEKSAVETYKNIPLDITKISTEEVSMDMGGGVTATVTREYVNNQVVIELQSGKTIDDLRAILPSGYSVGGWNTDTLVYQVTIPSSVNVSQAITAVSQLSSAVISTVGQNPVFKTCLTPNDPYFNTKYMDDRWGFVSIEATRAWDLTTGESSLIVAVVDTGVDLDHSEFSERIHSKYKKNFIANNDNPNDDSGHGTSVAGVLAATGNNGAYLAGMNWGSKIMAIKAIDEFDRTDGMTLGNAINYALDNGAKVVNVSNGGYLDPDNKSGDMTINNHLRRTADKAYSKSALIIAAAGNEGNNVSKFYPAALAALNNSPVIAVGGYGQDGKRWNDSNGSSNYGTGVNLCAPAHKILTTHFDGTVQSNQWGTSIAAPFVSGVASMIYSLYSGSTSLGVKSALTDDESTDAATSEADKPIGRKLNAWKALLRAAYYNAQAVVSVASSVGGATIYVDGTSTGKVTTTEGYTRIMVSSGSRTIKVSPSGYTDASTTINCTKGTNTEVTLNPSSQTSTTTTTTSTTTTTLMISGDTSTSLEANNGYFRIRVDYTSSSTPNLLNHLSLSSQSSNWLNRTLYPSPCLTQTEPFWDASPGVTDRSLTIVKNTSSIAAIKSQFCVSYGNKKLRANWTFILPGDKEYAIWVASYESVGTDKTLTVDNPSNYGVQDVYFFYPLQPTPESGSYYIAEEDSSSVAWSSSTDTSTFNSSTNRYFSVFNGNGCFTFGYFGSNCSTDPKWLSYLNSEMGYKSVFSTINSVSLTAASPNAQWVGIISLHDSTSEQAVKSKAASLYSDAASNLSTYLQALQ